MRPLAVGAVCLGDRGPGQQLQLLASHPPTLLSALPRLFGKLFDETQDIFEALGGTLKAAKKQGLISYSAMILLKGQHDKVPIVLEKEAPEEAA